MARREVYDCDRCGKTISGMYDRVIEVIRVSIGRSFDGVETSNDVEHIDLCHKCCRLALIELLDNVDRTSGTDPFGRRKEWVKKWKCFKHGG